ncbi:MAG: glycine cleavage system H protein [Candidatus Poribacteria bacterium]|nr:MAG: glycine cleavage system H protein [Candidatus Poribacteria bacterium]
MAALKFPEDCRFLPETHEWARLEGQIATIGISDYAQHEIGDVVYVELPEVGEQLQAEQEFGVIESVKSAFDLYAPLSGEVVEVNTALEEHPEWVNEDPYGQGWMVRIRVSNPEEWERLADAETYRRSVEEG